MKIKTSELLGDALDWAVARCEGKENTWGKSSLKPYEHYKGHAYSADWALGGPIIERWKINIECPRGYAWHANMWQNSGFFAVGYGDTPLVAAMRCYVNHRLGDEVEVPDELQANKGEDK